MIFIKTAPDAAPSHLAHAAHARASLRGLIAELSRTRRKLEVILGDWPESGPPFERRRLRRLHADLCAAHARAEDTLADLLATH